MKNFGPKVRAMLSPALFIVSLLIVLLPGRLLATANLWPLVNRNPCPAVELQWAIEKELPGVRDALTKTAHASRVPVMTKKFGTSSLPVILANHASAEHLAAFFSRSIGIMVQLQPGYRNDHGMLRVGKALIDVDTPGNRGYGELHATGISWKEVVGNMKRQSADSPVRVEVGFLLTEAEMKWAEYYQRVRRAAIFRVPFTFGTAKFDETAPNALKSGGEMCFTFCQGSAVQSQIAAVKRELSTLLPGFNPETVPENPRMVEFLGHVRERVLSWEVSFGDKDVKSDAFNNGALAKMTIDGKPLLDAYADIFPGLETPKDRLKAANWLVALDSATGYAKLMGSLQVRNGTGWESVSSTRASFVVVYDYRPDSPVKFSDATYTADGIFNSWRADGQVRYQP